jgi:hypothetical protein
VEELLVAADATRRREPIPGETVDRGNGHRDPSVVAVSVDVRSDRHSSPGSTEVDRAFGVRRRRWSGPVCTGLVEEAEPESALGHARQLGGTLAVLRPAVSVGLSRPHGATDVAEAVGEARRAAIYALTTPGATAREIADFPVEEAMARDQDALIHAASHLEGLDEELLLSLTVFYGTDGDRERAAAALVVHLRTLDYRLRRVRRVTGFAPRSLYGSRILRPALAARELLESPGACRPPVWVARRHETGVRT